MTHDELHINCMYMYINQLYLQKEGVNNLFMKH